MVGMRAASQPDSRMTSLIVGDSMISPENLAASLYGPLFSQIHRLMLKKCSRDELASGIGEIQITFPELDEPLRIRELAGNSEEALLEWARTVEQLDPEALAMSLDLSAFEGWEPERLLPRIACPVLLLQANPELDGLLTDADVKRAMGLLPQAQHVRFPLLGHALFMQQAKPILRVVTDFLERHARNTGSRELRDC
jgi:pimeloyl-ACP methyl ester carboxylesterase